MAEERSQSTASPHARTGHCQLSPLNDSGLEDHENGVFVNPDYTISSLTLVSSLAAFTRSSVRIA